MKGEDSDEGTAAAETLALMSENKCVCVGAGARGDLFSQGNRPLFVSQQLSHTGVRSLASVAAWLDNIPFTSMLTARWRGA